MGKNITKREALKSLSELVEGREDAVMECVYGDYGADDKLYPICIVGAFVYKHFGEDGLSTMIDYGQIYVGSEARQTVAKMGVTEGALDVLYEAQQAQDYGKPWGVALEVAKSVRKGVKNV